MAILHEKRLLTSCLLDKSIVNEVKSEKRKFERSWKEWGTSNARIAATCWSVNGGAILSPVHHRSAKRKKCFDSSD
jgi:hypothetical protein